MAELYVAGANNNIKRLGATDYTWLGARGLRDGSVVEASLMEALAHEGRIFTANMGTAATPITLLAYAVNRPDAWVRVPSGTAILPLQCTISLDAMAGTATKLEIRTAQNDIGNGTSSAADVGPRSLRTDAPIASNCVARQLATLDTTAETGPLTLWRREYILANAAGEDAKGFTVTRDMMGYPVLVGGASWEVFVSATTTQAAGYVVMTWAEVPSTMFT